MHSKCLLFSPLTPRVGTEDQNQLVSESGLLHIKLKVVLKNQTNFALHKTLTTEVGPG